MGFDKRHFIWESSSLLGHAIKLIQNCFGRNPILAGDDPALTSSGLEVICDKLPGQGPLGGLVSSLENCPTLWALVLAADLPLLQPPDLNLLLEQDRKDFQMLTLSIDRKPEPLAALYNKDSLEFWKKRLESGQLSLRDGFEYLPWDAVLLNENSNSLKNFNSPGDLKYLTKIEINDSD